MPEETEVTAEATEQSGSQTENANQEDFTAKLQALEARLAEYQGIDSKVKALEEENRRNQAEALRWQSGYKGLQASTTAKLQEAANLQRQLQDAQATSGQLEALRETVNLLARRMLDEDQAKEFDLQQRELRIRQQEEQVRRSQAAPQQQTQQPVEQYIDPEIAKKQYMDYYFPGVNIDPSHPEIDWGDGAQTTQEAFRRFTVSVTKLMSSQKPKEEPKAEKPQEDFRAELEKAKQLAIEEAKAQARKDVEDRLRKLGIDAGDAGTPASDSSRKLKVELDDLDESLLYQGEINSPARKKAMQEYDKKLSELRRKLISQ